MQTALPYNIGGYFLFGYIKPYKPEMKMREWDTFKAVYCGLCKQLSHVYGPFSSLTLSYDFTFIATISIGMSDSCAGFKKCSCVANPLKKKACLLPCDDLTLCASVAMLMIYYKLKDDIEDSGFLGKLRGYLLLPFASSAKNKARKIYPEIDKIISSAIKNQAQVEKSDNKSTDRAAHPTADALALICERLSPDVSQKAILNRFGYLVGRYVYFADALDDLEKDIKTNSYNPFIKKFEGENKSIEAIKEYGKSVLNLTIGEIPPAYELLNLKRHKEILDNIIYLGLHNEIDIILEKNDKVPKPTLE